MTYLEARTAVNSLFGAYTIGRNSNTIRYDREDITNDNIYDNILRGRDGIQRKMQESEKITQALENPALFLTAKRDDLHEMIAKLNTEFRLVFERQLKRNLPLKETRENTRKEIDTLYERLMKYHKEDFPDSLVQRAIKKATGGN